MPKPKDHVGNNFSARHDRFGMTGGVPSEYKPPRDVNVPVISVVACPSCMAPIGEKCISIAAGTTFTSGSHPVRRRMAVRIFNAQRASTA